jgi:hypothetical protein
VKSLSTVRLTPARRPARAKAKDASKHTPAGCPPYRYRDLLEHLATLGRQTIVFAGQRIEKLTSPPDGYPAQRSCSIASAPDGTRVELTV